MKTPYLSPILLFITLIILSLHGILCEKERINEQAKGKAATVKIKRDSSDRIIPIETILKLRKNKK